MARKRRPQEAAAKDGVFFVTYVGPLDAVFYMGLSFAYGKPVEVENPAPFACRSFFKVTHGLQPD